MKNSRREGKLSLTSFREPTWYYQSIRRAEWACSRNVGTPASNWKWYAFRCLGSAQIHWKPSSQRCLLSIECNVLDKSDLVTCVKLKTCPGLETMQRIINMTFYLLERLIMFLVILCGRHSWFDVWWICCSSWRWEWNPCGINHLWYQTPSLIIYNRNQAP